MVKYSLFENNLTPDPEDHVAGVQPISTKSMEDVVDSMISRGSTVTKAEALSVMEELMLAIVLLLKDGHNVVTPLFKLSLSITGVFTNGNDAFDPSRHQVKVRINPGVRLREVTEKIKVEKVTTTRPMPLLQSFRDVTSATESEFITPGGVGHLTGNLLKFNPAEAVQGVFFTTPAGVATKAEIVVSVKPSEVIFVIPASLTAGEYSVSLRTLINNTKEIREGFLIDNLIVK